MAAAGWGRQRRPSAALRASLARICLICDLVHDLAVQEETIPLVLSLVDQVYSLRRQLNALTAAIRQQPDDVRRRILDLLTERPGTPGANG